MSFIQKSEKKIPLRYVVIGVTLYCAIAWTIAIIGINAGMKNVSRPAAIAAAEQH